MDVLKGMENVDSLYLDHLLKDVGANALAEAIVVVLYSWMKREGEILFLKRVLQHCDTGRLLSYAQKEWKDVYLFQQLLIDLQT